MEHSVWTGHNLNNVQVGGLNGNKSDMVRKDKIGNEWCVAVLTTIPLPRFMGKICIQIIV